MKRDTLKALIDAGALTGVRIIGRGSQLYVEGDTRNGSFAVSTIGGTPKTWKTIDACARWIRDLGVAEIELDIKSWQPGQRDLPL